MFAHCGTLMFDVVLLLCTICNRLHYGGEAKCVPSDGLTAAGAGVTCPEKCQCRNNSVNCYRKSLNNVPDNLPSSTESLELGLNNIEQLTSYDFEGCSRMKNIHLSRNQIRHIAPGTFSSTRKLNRLSLNDNKLRYDILPDGTFDGLENLKILNMGHNMWNETTHYNGPIFRPLVRLYNLAIDGIGDVPFPQEFAALRDLNELEINSGMTRVTNDTFAAFGNSQIETLTIANTATLYELEPMSFSKLKRLEELNLSGNQRLGLINASRAWYSLQFTNIRRLYLTDVTPRGEQPVRLNDSFFKYLNMTKLSLLSLTGNNIAYVPPRFSESLGKLYELYMAANGIVNFEELMDDISKLHNLLILDVSRWILPILSSARLFSRTDDTILGDARADLYEDSGSINCRNQNWMKYPRCCIPQKDELHGANEYAPLFNRRSYALCVKLPPNLQFLNLEESVVAAWHTLPQVVIIGGTFLKRVNLRLNSLHRVEGQIYFTEPPTGLTLNFSDNMINCFAPRLFSHWSGNGNGIAGLNLAGNRLAEQISADVEGRMFDDGEYEYLTTLNLAQNGLKSLPPRIFTKLSHLSTLNLSYNSLRLIDFRYDHMVDLRLMDLSYNLISSLTDNHLRNLSIMFERAKRQGLNVALNLHGNPLQCSCQTLQFLHWLEANKPHLVKFNSYSCMYYEKYVTFAKLSSLILPALEFECSTRLAVIVSGTLLGVVLILLSMSTVCYRHRWEIRYACLKLTQRGQRYQQIVDQTVHYEYDAFVVYDSEDRQWVNDILVPHLEDSDITTGGVVTLSNIQSSVNTDSRIRLCIHERDFPPGEDIIGNIWNRMERSRKVILVISKHFTQSYYCDYEMNLARLHSVEQGRNLIVPILLDQPDVDRVSNCLHWIMHRVTYIEWPQEDGEREEFWQRLRDVLRSNDDNHMFQY